MSRASSPSLGSLNPTRLFTSREEKLQLEARNGLLQFDEVLRLIASLGGNLNLSTELLKGLQRIAIQGIYTCAGNFRNGPITIGGSIHDPPPHGEVQRLVQEMCDYANGGTDKSPIHTASYLLWRLNWIHPFSGGNGRTSRAVSYLALCVRLGFPLPGKITIPEQIVANRQPYYDALDEADAIWKAEHRVDVSKMETLMSNMLAKQLVNIHETATNSPP